MVKSVWDELKADLQGVHLRAQAVRFLRLAGASFVLQVAALGAGHLSREALAAAGLGALEVAVRQVFPVVPWDALKSKATPSVAPAAAAGPGVVPPGSVS